MKLFDTAPTNVYDYESGLPSGYFADPGGQISANVVATNTLSQLGVITNHVLAVNVVAPRAWAGLQGFNVSPAQDWSAYDGVSFWFKGTNSGKTFLYAITQGSGAGLYQASFKDNTTGWKLVNLPWQAFTYREGATGTPILSLTSVTAYFIQFSDNGGDTGFTERSISIRWPSSARPARSTSIRSPVPSTRPRQPGGRAKSLSHPRVTQSVKTLAAP